MTKYQVGGMTCAACQAHVEKAVSKVEGVDSVSVSLLTNSMTVEGTADPGTVISAVEKAGYTAALQDSSENKTTNIRASEEDALKDRSTPALLKRLILSLCFLLPLMYFSMGHNMWGWPVPTAFHDNPIGLSILQMLFAIVIIAINRAFFLSGIKSALHGAPNMDTLVSLGAGVSFGWSVFVLFRMTYLQAVGTELAVISSLYHNQLYFESCAMILTLITIGKTLESYSKGRTTDALKDLLKMSPQTAVLERNGEIVTVPVEDVTIGDVFQVKPGEAIPVDGVILEGTTAIDESALTGESMPVEKKVDDTVSAATINQSGFIRARAVRVGKDTTFSQIIRMVSEAGSSKAPIARIADKVSGIFVPTVLLIAAAVLVIWLLLGQTVPFALERAICVLVISCPCALGLATPVAIMVGNGVGAKNGILFKTGESLENTGKVQIVAMDKTGTITAGKPEVTDIVAADGVSEKELLSLACALEAKSEHPLALAVTEKGKEEDIQAETATEFHALAGNGAEAVLDGSVLRGGSLSYISSLVEIPEKFKEKSIALAESGKTPLFFTSDSKFLGIIAVADRIKQDSAEAVRQLSGLGIETVMLTGDNARTAAAIGKEAGVKHVIAGVLPDGKDNIIRSLQRNGSVAMVGDGINDAPALTRADIGIAIGNGTDVAIDSADVVLMNSHPADVPAAIRLSRAVMRNIYENLFWAFGYNIILIPLAAGVYPGVTVNPMWGAAAMSISSFIVCMNALRLNLVKVHDASHDRKKRNRAGEMTFDVLQEEQEQLLSEETLHVEGMTCDHCVRTVEKAIRSVEGVREAKADLKTGDVEIRFSGDVSEDCLKNAIENAGYHYDGIQRNKEENMMKKTLKIEGMMCEHCENRVKKALEAIDGVDSAVASHDSGTAIVTLSHDVAEEEFRKAVEAQDYKYLGIQ